MRNLGIDKRGIDKRVLARMLAAAGLVVAGLVLIMADAAGVPAAAADAPIMRPQAAERPACQSGHCVPRRKRYSACPDGYSCYPLYGAYGPYGGVGYWGGYTVSGWGGGR